jgi:hypothetical protein
MNGRHAALAAALASLLMVGLLAGWELTIAFIQTGD